MSKQSDQSGPKGPSGAAPAWNVVLLGDSLLPVRGDLRGAGGLEDAIVPKPRFPWKLTAVSAAQIATRGPGAAFPDDATHIVINIEGNNAIATSGLLQGHAAAWRGALAQLSAAADAFERHIAILVRAALTTRLPVLVCTMYPPRYPEHEEQQAALAALAVFNDRILKCAVAAGFAIADLRHLGSHSELYASSTQLSLQGLQHVTDIIRHALDVVKREAARSEVFY
jgi:hypothetical protein